ncbi:MAG: efflux RND transporter periplasmic adaptor subunit [Bacteroidia bacterium]|nr:efflux RND transporter periplasmic adaptor subunit [Bacteroidia bacterium]MDW8157822.1 efflux RND transporter periplasmic adaptor subunit [Bacteroidia bacterium]
MILTLLLLAIGNNSCNSKNEQSIHPFRKDIVFAVFASGKINPKHIYNVVPKISGYVSKILVEVGQIVKSGQPLVVIRSETNEKNLEIARNQFLLAQKNLSEQSPLVNAARQEKESAKIRYELDSINFERYRTLWSQKVVTTQQYEQAKTQFEIAKRNYQKSLHNLRQIENQVQTEYQNAKLLLESQQSNLNEFTILSSIDGKVYDLMAQEGELVTTNTALLVIGNAQDFETELYIDEKDISFVKPGQKVIYEISAYRGKFFEGQVQKIYPRINPTNKTCKIIATIHTQDFEFYAGLSLEANIIISERKNALVIPKSFLFNNENVIRKEKQDTIKIIKGIEDLEYVEILGGIDEKTEIIKP